MEKLKDFALAIGTYVGFFAVVIGIVWLSSLGSDTSKPESDPAVDVYESQVEAESRQEDAVIQQERSEPESYGYCVDETSYDYNWDNDMLCTRPDGSTFYTDYESARLYELEF